ncbi:MAG: exosortase/archaeosortase family protein [Puniceicoccaceae bacterium]
MNFRSLPVSTQWAAYALAGLSLFLIWDQHHWWKLRDEYAFGFIVPLFVAYILYERWPLIAGGLIGEEDSSPKDGASKGSLILVDRGLQAISLLMVLGGLLSFLLGVLYRAMEGQNLIASNFLAFGYANILLGGAYLYSGRRAGGETIGLPERWHLAMLFLFPALIWMLSVPMFNAVHKTISTFLMNKVAIVVYHSFDLLGYAVVREGSVLKLPLGDVGVEDACSGIRSLTACLFAGSFLGSVYFAQFWKKVFLVGTAMLFAFINNIFRSLFLTAWAYGHGPEGLNDHVVIFGMDLGNIHDFTGWVVLGLTVICLLLLVKIFSIRLEYELPEEELNESASTD